MKWLLLLSIVALVRGGTINSNSVSPNVNSWRREAATAATSAVGSGGNSNLNSNSNTAQLVYSTLPDNIKEGAALGGNFFDYQEQGKQHQQQTQPQPQPFIYHEQQPQQFPQMQHQPQPMFPFPENGGFGGFGGPQDFPLQPFQQFDGSNNEIQQDDDSQGFLSSAMSAILDASGLSGLWGRMREMWSSLTGGSEFFSGSSTMSRLMMGAMALPFMLPMAALPLGMGALALMSFPILQLTLPGIRRSLGRGAALSHSVLVAEECMERLSCNLAKVATKFPYDGSIFSRFERSENQWLSRVSKSVKAARTGEDCKRFSCSPVSNLQTMVKNYLGFAPVVKEKQKEKEESDGVSKKRELGNKKEN